MFIAGIRPRQPESVIGNILGIPHPIVKRPPICVGIGSMLRTLHRMDPFPIDASAARPCGFPQFGKNHLRICLPDVGESSSILSASPRRNRAFAGIEVVHVVGHGIVGRRQEQVGGRMTHVDLVDDDQRHRNIAHRGRQFDTLWPVIHDSGEVFRRSTSEVVGIGHDHRAGIYRLRRLSRFGRRRGADRDRRKIEHETMITFVIRPSVQANIRRCSIAGAGIAAPRADPVRGAGSHAGPTDGVS